MVNTSKQQAEWNPRPNVANHPEAHDYFAPPDAPSSVAPQTVEPFAPTPEATVCLSFDHLKAFETVDRQFKHMGVTFKNAIALKPSNPAFQPDQGEIVLMGSPRGGWLEASFDHPVRFVSGMVTGSRKTVMAAFDGNNRQIAQTATAGANLAGSDAAMPPGLELKLLARDIRRITFHVFDGQLTINQLGFGG